MTRLQINTALVQLGIARAALDLEGGMSGAIRQEKKAEIDQKVAQLNRLLAEKGEMTRQTKEQKIKDLKIKKSALVVQVKGIHREIKRLEAKPKEEKDA